MQNPLYPDAKPTGIATKILADNQPSPSYFHLVAAIAIYQTGKDEGPKQRHVNVMLETSSPNIMRSDLDQVNQGVMTRLNVENNVQPEEMRDIVLLNISRLAIASSKDFYYGQNLEETPEG